MIHLFAQLTSECEFTTLSKAYSNGHTEQQTKTMGSPMSELNQHWNQIFDNKQGDELGWFEDDISQTLKFVDQMSLSAPSRIFIPGAGTSQLVDKLYADCHQLLLNDLSDSALAQLKERLIQDHDRENNAEYLVQDISQPLNIEADSIDAWIDRAVFHFLLNENAIQGYFNNLKSAVKKGGYVLLAEFSKQGDKKCAGLGVHQYDLKEMQQRLGSGFQLIAAEEFEFINPFGDSRPYIYGLFKRQ